MQKFGIASVMALLVWSASISGSTSAPVTSVDLTGKTICWHDSQGLGDCTASYAENGKYSNSESMFCGPAGEGTWAITPDGVKIVTESRNWTSNIDKLPDGTFLSSTKTSNTILKATGTYCK
jgi:hypothetical protein